MRPLTIVYVTDMARSLAWYRSLLPDAELVSSSPFWSEFAADGGTLALHAAESIDPGNQVGLSLVAEEPLEAIGAQLDSFYIDVVRSIHDEPFGRSMVVEDPDGLKIQINEHLPPGS